MEPITFQWIWKDLIGKTSWNPSDSTGIDKVWVLKSHGTHKIPLVLIRFESHDFMNPTGFHWIPWVPMQLPSWFPTPAHWTAKQFPWKKTSGIKAFLMKYHQKQGDFDGLMPQCYKWMLSHFNGFPIVIPTIPHHSLSFSLFHFYYHSLVSIWWCWWNPISIHPMSDPCPHSIHPSPF